MVFSLTDLDSFEHWFYKKLIKEKQRRIEQISNLWNQLVPNQRVDLILFTKNYVLIRFSNVIIGKLFDDLYTVIRENLLNSFELIEKWEENNL